MRFFLATIVFILAFLTSCSPPDKKYKIGVSQCSDDIWRDKQNSEMKMAAYSQDVELAFAAAYDNDELQVKQIDSLADIGVNLIIVSPNTITTVTPAIERAYDKGIPVILFERKANTSKFYAYVGADNYEMGRMMGKYICTRLNGKGNVVEVMGLMGSSSAIDRHNGFMAALKEYPEVKVIDSFSCDWTPAMAYRESKKRADIIAQADLVFAANDRMAVAVRQMLQDEKKLRPGQLFCGIDGLPGEDGGIKQVRDNILDATIINPTHGDRLIELALNILIGKPYSREELIMSALVTEDNANLLYIQNRETADLSAYLEDLRSKVDSTLDVLNNQRIYLMTLVLIVVLLLVACGYAYYAYITKAKYNEKLKKSYDRQLQLGKEVEELNDERLGFYTHVSHELRTPLTLIADPVERLLDDTSIEGKQRGLLERVYRGIISLKTLINDIIDFRNIDLGNMRLHYSRFCFSESLHRWTDAVEDMLTKKYIEISLDTYDADGEEIIADKEKVNRIYFNMLQSALRYSVAGMLLTVKLCKKGDKFILTCLNNKMFLSDEEVENLFKRFKYSSGMTGGIALSLANIKAFTELHGGTVEAHVIEGEGTLLTITLPSTQEGYVETAADDAAAEDYAKMVMLDQYANSDVEERRKSELAGVDNNKPTLLVVDDNSEVRLYIKSLLEEKYNVTEAANGMDGLAVARQLVPDIVISDVMMPYMDGIELCKTLKADTVTSHIPVILLTARALDDHQAEGLESGADAYIRKPFSSKVLMAQVGSLLRNRHLLKVLWSNVMPEETENTMEIPRADGKTTGVAHPFTPLIPTAEDAFIMKLLGKIEDAMSDSNLSVEQIGEQMGMSRVQLYRKVKALTGTTPVDLIRKARLSRARQLLESKSGTVSEVAYKVGFATPSYFSKCFKDEFGMQPNEVIPDN